MKFPGWFWPSLWGCGIAAMFGAFVLDAVNESREREARQACNESAKKHSLFSGAYMHDLDAVYVGGDCVIRDRSGRETKLLNQHTIDAEWRKVLEEAK